MNWDQFETRIFAGKRMFSAGAELRLIFRSRKNLPFLTLQNFGRFPLSDRNPFDQPFPVASESSPQTSEKS
jgi:hypothetical protein